MNESKQSFESWAIIELFGHQRMAGFVTEATIGGQSFVRVDVPEVEGHEAYTRFLGNGAIYAMTPCDENTARRAAAAFRPKPVQAWELPEPNLALPAGEAAIVDDDEDDDIHAF